MKTCFSKSDLTVKILKIRTPEKFAVVTLNFEEDGLAEE